MPRIAQTLTDGLYEDFEHIVSNGRVTIAKYTGSAKQVTIPSRLNKLPVTAIGDEAFAHNRLTSVSIPTSITAIGDYAFYRNQLTSVRIPANVDIQVSSFYGLLYVHYIANNRKAAFYTFSLSNSGDFEIVISGNAVEITGYHGGKTDIEIPGKINTIPVTAIGDWAFAESALTSVSIGANVQVAGGEYPSFDGNFAEVYDEAGKQAGTYRFSSGTWKRQ
jgi:hypothetical protein